MRYEWFKKIKLPGLRPNKFTSGRFKVISELLIFHVQAALKHAKNNLLPCRTHRVHLSIRTWQNEFYGSTQRNAQQTSQPAICDDTHGPTGSRPGSTADRVAQQYLLQDISLQAGLNQYMKSAMEQHVRRWDTVAAMEATAREPLIHSHLW